MVFIDENIKIEKTEYEGEDYISVRKWYKDRATGELKPTRSGINFSMDAWKEFIEKFDEIVEDMEMSWQNKNNFI